MKHNNAKSHNRRKSNHVRNAQPGPQGVTSIPRNFTSTTVAGVAPHIRRTLAWTYNYGTSLSSGGAYYNVAQVCLNNPYDPDYAIGGTSAAGFAKYMQLYSKCFVLSARATTKFALSASSFAGSPPAAVIIGQTITTNTTSLGSVANAINAGLCDYRVHNVNPDSGILTSAVNVAKFVDKPDILDDPQFFTTVSSGPGQVIVLHLWAINPSGAGTSYVNYIMNVDMDCIFTDPIPFT